ncbi:hypothetical protein BGZ61DRAFT_202446 [Ilyonectria robusta]|uniref:uncharacterized protein n=1 Tax=Ilyonectria robusta TaxID=1079257 RepID=UPI001E8ED3C2|nr:uncharacterized protein BGZ61DRAFT_202446 [Ilyonectria robusta]KAH8722289.1 hypothetical protein BGZ61DRAFT_202446 [Ilyonectria robusta]
MGFVTAQFQGSRLTHGAEHIMEMKRNKLGAFFRFSLFVLLVESVEFASGESPGSVDDAPKLSPASTFITRQGLARQNLAFRRL